MNVCHVSGSLCPRVVKIAYTQQRHGIKTYWIGGSRKKHETVFPFETFEMYQEGRFGGLATPMHKLNGRVDLYHVHTHWMDTQLYDDALKYAKRPVVLDVHDPQVVPFNKQPSSWLAAVDRLAKGGGTTYKTYCPADWFVPPRPSVRGKDLIIATRISKEPMHWRDWLQHFQMIKKIGLNLHCYTSSEVTNAYYDAAKILPPISLDLLLKRMSGFRAGLTGSPYPDDHMKSAHPNKLYEYLAAGIPVICLDSRHDMAKTIEKAGVGVVIESIKELPAALKECDRIRPLIAHRRQEFCMETQLPIVLRFYKDVLFPKESTATRQPVVQSC